MLVPGVLVHRLPEVLGLVARVTLPQVGPLRRQDRVDEESQEEDEKTEEGQGSLLPPLEKDERLVLIRLLPQQHFTKPPPRYSDATLIRTLEEYGIGRPSTYAPILTTIQQRGYVERVDKKLVPTELGFTVNDLLVA